MAPTASSLGFVTRNNGEVVDACKLGLELLCRVLEVAPSTYYAARDSAQSAIALSGAVLSGGLFDLRANNLKGMGSGNSGRQRNGQGLMLGGIKQPG